MKLALANRAGKDDRLHIVAAATSARIAELTGRWQAVPVGGQMTLELPEHPR